MCSIYLELWQKAWSTPSTLAPLLTSSKSPLQSFSASCFFWKLLPVLLLPPLWLPPLPLPKIMLCPFSWVKPAGHMHPCCICLACLSWPFDPPLSLTFRTYLRLITNFFFWFSKAHCSLNTRWSSYISLSNYEFSKINFSSNNDDIQNTSLMANTCVIE